MATVEVELRPYKKANGTQPLVLRVTAGKRISRKNTGLYIRAEEWDAAKHRVNRRHPEWSRLNDALDTLRREAEGVKADIIRERQLVTPDRVISAVFATNDFYALAQQKVASFDPSQSGSAGTYLRMLARVKAYAGPALSVEEISESWLSGFKAWLKHDAPNDLADGGLGYSHNTVVGTLTKLRAVLHTVDLKGADPFKKVSVGGYRRAKDEPLEMEDIRKLERYLPRGKWQHIAKDTALFSFYSFGMRSADVLQLRWSNIKGDRIVYDQSKKANSSEEPSLSVPLNRYTREILSRYDQSTDTVFNLLTLFGGTTAARKQRENVQACISSALTVMCLRAGITKPVNFKLFRRSFAHTANQMSGRNVYAIQTAMDHRDIRTTEIYLGKDTRAIDELCAVVYGEAG